MKLKTILHNQITEVDLAQIINIKAKHWKYSIEEHKKWIDKNIGSLDEHLLLYEENQLIAYLNLVKIEVIVNNKKLPFLGVGNVCSYKKGYGYGKKLIEMTNNFLIDNQQQGILLCKNELLDFYSKSNWKIIHQEKIKSKALKDINVMVFNYDNNITELDYNDRNF